MNDIFKHLQQKDIKPVPKTFPAPVHIIHAGYWRKEQHISELIPFVLNEIGKKYINYHKQLIAEGIK